MFIKKWIALACTFTLLLSGCSQSAPAKDYVALQEDVEFKLMDVLKIDNTSTNLIYYYFLASIDNTSSHTYYMNNLEYTISSNGQESISAMDRYQSTISNSIAPDRSSYVYGYVGFPNMDQENIGLYFPRSDNFLPFDSIQVRTIEDENVKNSTESKFVLYEDDNFLFEVDSSKVAYNYEAGISTVSGLEITYTNKSENRLVVPFITPICTMEAIRLSDYDAKKLSDMSLEELKKQDFRKDGLAPKTEEVKGEALGYQLFYLDKEQSYTCQISFEFNDAIPDFQTGSDKAVLIDLDSASLGYSQQISVRYK